MSQVTENQILGALLGMAIGDALGAPIAGFSRSEIAQRHGAVDRFLPIVDAESDESHTGEFTDETEISLCIVEALTANRGLFDAETIGVRMLHLARGESRRWLQAATRDALDAAAESLDFVAPMREDDPATGDVAARGVPIGLLHAVGTFDEAAFRADAEAVTRLTHGGPAAINATTAVAYAIRLAALGAPPDTWARETASFVGGGELANRLAGLNQAVAGTSVAAALDATGVGLDALESIPAAIAAATLEPVFENAVFAAVNAGGAADTIGALTGALAGAGGGASGIPQHLIDGLEGRIYVSLAAPWFFKAARQRAGQLIDLRPVHGPRPELPPRQ